MYEEHPVFEPPRDDGVTIWRYVDLVKFVSVLQTRSLYLPRADLLGDPHECSVPERTLTARRSLDAAPSGSWEHDVRLDLPRVLVPRAVFVSCWNVSEYENAALWSVYGKSIAIETTFGALRDSFASLAVPVHLGCVKYIDYDTEEFPPPDNLLHAVVHKRRFFENERELRAVILGQPNFSDWHYRDAPTSLLGDPRPAVTVPVDLAGLMRRVWIAPEQTMLDGVVRGLLQRYDLPDVNVQASRLDDVAWRF